MIRQMLMGVEDLQSADTSLLGAENAGNTCYIDGFD
jgi:hypothetical protein